MNIFYVYILFRPWNGEPFYVGKGKGNRWGDHERRSECHPNRYLTHIVKKAKRLNLDIPKVKIRENLTESEAFVIERAFIAAIGRRLRGGPLVNMTDGGEGSSGFVQSAASIAKRAAAARGNKWALGCKRSPETIAKLRARRHSDETKAKLSAKHSGKKLTPEHRAKLRTAKLGKTLGTEHREKIGRAHVGMKRSAEARHRMSEAQRGNTHGFTIGHPVSAEIREKISRAAKIRWANPEFRARFRAGKPHLY